MAALPQAPGQNDRNAALNNTAPAERSTRAAGPESPGPAPRTSTGATSTINAVNSTTTTTTSFPTQLSDLAPREHVVAPSLYKTLNALHHRTLSPLARLRSIASDASFVAALHAHVGRLPVLANERCGGWYVPPELKGGSAYFKSTDGHYGQWAFSLRRLNLGVLEVLGREGTRGAVLVDSTRRGKAWSDALRRTVPVWVAVVNNVLFAGRDGDGRGREGLQSLMGEEGVGKSERAQIEARLEGWEEEFRALGVDLEGLRGVLERRVRCVWASNGTWDFGQDWESMRRDMGDVNVLVLASASRRVRGAEMSEGGYVQGAGDDSEGWARGLKSQMWWEHKDRLLEAGEGEVEGLIDEIVADAEAKQGTGEGVRVDKAPNLHVGSGGRATAEGFDLVINCNGDGEESKSVLSLNCREGKLGSKDLRDRLAKVKDAVGTVLQRNPDSRILVTCSTGRDLSVGTALSLTCLLYDESGVLNANGRPAFTDKMVIKQRLVWITTCKPDANPSRATLQAVNSFLIARPS